MLTETESKAEWYYLLACLMFEGYCPEPRCSLGGECGPEWSVLDDDGEEIIWGGELDSDGLPGEPDDYVTALLWSLIDR